MSCDTTIYRSRTTFTGSGHEHTVLRTPVLEHQGWGLGETLAGEFEIANGQTIEVETFNLIEVLTSYIQTIEDEDILHELNEGLTEIEGIARDGFDVAINIDW
jgi:hypothetical protein